MPRIARCVVPGIPHHVTQRGNRRQRTFFDDADYLHYKSLLQQACAKHEVVIWAYCLMPNHVHLILEPSAPDSLRRAAGSTHQRYTWHLNHRMHWRGYLWQGRFWSYPMDELHLYSATRYILQNPVRSGLVARAEEWPHSSARAHLYRLSDGIVAIEPLDQRVVDWQAILSRPVDSAVAGKLLRHSRSGMPLGSRTFVEEIERRLGGPLRLRAVGRPSKRDSR